MGKYTYFDIESDRLIEPSEVDNALQKLPKEWQKTILCCLYIFGCRVNEALQLRVRDFKADLEYFWVDIPNSKRMKGQKTILPPFRTLKVRLDTPYLEYLMNWLEKKDLTVGRDGLVFPYTRVAVWYFLKKVQPNLSPHKFRHNRLTKVAMDEANPLVIQSLAGHSSIKSSQKYLDKSGIIAQKYAERHKIT